MRIKAPEGQTLLTLFRVGVVAIACLIIGPVASWADKTFSLAANANELMQSFLRGEEPADISTLPGEPMALFYTELPAEGNAGDSYNIYKQFYLLHGEGDLVGLTDGAGKEILPCRYEGIQLLPHAYVLKQNGKWGFYDADTLAPLSDQSWDDVQRDLDENGRFASSLLRVGRDGLYGATDFSGNVVIEPKYQSLTLSSLSALWPLIGVQQDNLYGFIDSSDQVVIPLRYQYAVMDTYTVYADENNAEGIEVPVVYVCLDGEWGGIFRNEDGSAQTPDWEVEPTEEVLAAAAEASI